MDHGFGHRVLTAGDGWVQTRERYAPRPEQPALYRKIFENRQQILQGPLRELFDRLEEPAALVK